MCLLFRTNKNLLLRWLGQLVKPAWGQIMAMIQLKTVLIIRRPMVKLCAFCVHSGGGVQILMCMKFVVLGQQWECGYWTAVNDGCSYLRGCLPRVLPDRQAGGQAPGGLSTVACLPGNGHQKTQASYTDHSVHFAHHLFAPSLAPPYGIPPLSSTT